VTAATSERGLLATIYAMIAIPVALPVVDVVGPWVRAAVAWVTGG